MLLHTNWHATCWQNCAVSRLRCCQVNVVDIVVQRFGASDVLLASLSVWLSLKVLCC